MPRQVISISAIFMPIIKTARLLTISVLCTNTELKRGKAWLIKAVRPFRGRYVPFLFLLIFFSNWNISCDLCGKHCSSCKQFEFVTFVLGPPIVGVHFLRKFPMETGVECPTIKKDCFRFKLSWIDNVKTVRSVLLAVICYVLVFHTCTVCTCSCTCLLCTMGFPVVVCHNTSHPKYFCSFSCSPLDLSRAPCSS